MKKGYTGLESSGKSLFLAKESKRILLRNAEWLSEGLVVRPIVSNLAYTDEFERLAVSLQVPIIYYKSLEEIKHLVGCDIICDEIGKFFDSRFWEKLSLEIRVWVAESAKQGVHWYFAAQDFAQIDLSFRRLVRPGFLTEVTKVMGSERPHPTFPAPKRIWGLMMLKELNPTSYDEKKKKFDDNLIPTFRFIRKADCEIFDTNKKVEADTNIVKRHVVCVCGLKGCDYKHIMHV